MRQHGESGGGGKQHERQHHAPDERQLTRCKGPVALAHMAAVRVEVQHVVEQIYR